MRMLLCYSANLFIQHIKYSLSSFVIKYNVHEIAQITMSRPNDKFEVSPTNQATCRKCHCRIQKGDDRIGMSHWWTMESRFPRWIHLYFHRSCVEQDADLMRTLRLPIRAATLKRTISDVKRNVGSIEELDSASSPSNERKRKKFEDLVENTSFTTVDQLAIEFEKAHKNLQKNIELYETRKNLVHMLRKLRMNIADRGGVEPYEVYHDTVIEGIVVLMPSTKQELLQVPGIGKYKCETLGSVLLSTIERYKCIYESNQSHCEDDMKNWERLMTLQIDDIISTLISRS